MSDATASAATLLQLFVDVAPREKSGAVTSDRFNFQKDWAVGRLLELHASGADYLVVLDFHDDVVVMDSATNPTEARFYQIKGRESGRWTIHGLTSTDTEGDPVRDGTGESRLSIIAKLYHNRIQFGDFVKGVTLVSNAQFNIDKLHPLADGPAVSIEGLETGDRDKVVNAIRSQLHAGSDHPDLHCVYVMVTSLSLTGHEVHTLGRVSRFLENTFPGKKYLAEPVYRVLYTEVDRRTGASSPDSIAGLLERKGLGRRDLVQLLHTLGASIDFQSGWETCKSILLRDGWAGREIVALESAWRRCEVDRMSQVTSLPYLRLRESATAFAAKSSREDNLSTYVANGDAELRKVCPGELTAYGTVYGKAMLLMELYANWESSPASAELEKEEP